MLNNGICYASAYIKDIISERLLKMFLSEILRKWVDVSVLRLHVFLNLHTFRPCEQKSKLYLH